MESGALSNWEDLDKIVLQKEVSPSEINICNFRQHIHRILESSNQQVKDSAHRVTINRLK